MKRFLFLWLLAILFAGCEGIGRGELYLVPSEYDRYESIMRYGINFSISSLDSDKIVISGKFSNPKYISLPTGDYRIYLKSVFVNHWGDPAYSDEITFTIRNGKTTRIDILPF
jgi:hypothetical protein